MTKISRDFKGIPVEVEDFDDVEEMLLTMTVEELAAYAADRFQARINTHRSVEGCVEDIMKLFELYDNDQGRVKFGYQDN